MASMAHDPDPFSGFCLHCWAPRVGQRMRVAESYKAAERGSMHRVDLAAGEEVEVFEVNEGWVFVQRPGERRAFCPGVLSHHADRVLQPV